MKFIHCKQHGTFHVLNEDGTCWCSCIPDPPNYGEDATLLESDTMEKAFEECRRLNLWLYHDWVIEQGKKNK